MAREIRSISLGPSDHDYAFVRQLFGHEFHVQRLGTDGNIRRARELVAQLDGQTDVIGLGGMNFHFQVGRHTFIHQQIQTVAHAAQATPVVDGTHMKNTLERWALSQVAQQQPELFRYRRIFVLSGVDCYATAQVLSQLTDRMVFGDPIFHLNLPITLKSFGQLERYAKWVLPRLCRAPYSRLFPVGPAPVHRTPRGAGFFKQADVIVGDIAYLRHFAPDDLRRKVIVTNSLSSSDLEDLKERGVESVVTLLPPFSDEHPLTDINVIEAIFTNLIDRPAAALTDDDYLDLVSRWDLKPQVMVLNEPPDIARFAFVIHPLTVNHIFNHPILQHLRFAPHRLVERLMANLPPLYLSRMTGIRSEATGKEVEGYLITLGATPREFMRRKPGFTYRRLIVASRMAQRMRAKIMGLGAFTKVVGDAGITVGQKADIAITSGNSLTVAATLEAAKQAVIKMGAKDLTKGRAMVIGATGSIGAVCSRLLAQAIYDVVLVAPRPERLIALKKTIEAETPDARVIIATDASPYLHDVDLVVTTTTAIGEKVIDVLKLKPGCVVCDVARPPDVKEEDARLRPDVLVIESGEVLLPGEPDFGFNIGLPPGVAYACLAEAALLAMEDRYENFTLGRNIEMERVKEIYRLFKKHGLQLEGLRSFGRYVSDEEVARKRELADELREHPAKLQALIAQAQVSESGRSAARSAAASNGRFRRSPVFTQRRLPFRLALLALAGLVSMWWQLRRSSNT
jgi:predicted amino acid dehydrogenase